jgi:NAD(P)-dependent dehydrogenase (short-subunit alcohol dehydrogenase family)
LHPNRQRQPQPVTRSSAATDSADSSTNTTELQHEPAFWEPLRVENLADLDQVASCAKTLLDRHDNLSALICNAGVMGGPLLLTPQRFERQMATNHLSHAALVAALWPR